MVELVTDCPRCGTKHITFDVQALALVRFQHGWHHTFEAFGVCRNCRRSTTFVLDEKVNHHQPDLFQKNSPLAMKDLALNEFFSVRGFVGLKDQAAAAPPEHVPDKIANVFREGATSLAIENWNAAGAMFRTCIDLATRALLPKEDVEGLNSKRRRDLGLRLPWLFEHGKLPLDLQELSTCIREDGNDAAHQGTLTQANAEDLLDFTAQLLERLFTEPTRLQIAKERRDKRRAPPSTDQKRA